MGQARIFCGGNRNCSSQHLHQDRVPNLHINLPQFSDQPIYCQIPIIVENFNNNSSSSLRQ